MQKNLDIQGRIIRLILAVLLFIIAWWQSSWIALGFGLFTLYEAFASWCILFQLLGINHCPIDRNEEKK